jgi:hypothetical protein
MNRDYFTTVSDFKRSVRTITGRGILPSMKTAEMRTNRAGDQGGLNSSIFQRYSFRFKPLITHHLPRFGNFDSHSRAFAARRG